jgi:uncharacterized membrane protein
MSEQEGRGSEETAGDRPTDEAVSKVTDTAGQSGNGGLASRVMKKEVLIPVAATAATAIAGVAARKGGVGEKIKQLGGETAEDVGRKTARGAKEEITGDGGAGGIAGGAVSKVLGRDGGGKSHQPKTRRLQIQRWTDVAVPVERAFEAWTNFEEYPKFMHRVLSVKAEDDNKVTWDEKIWFSTRHWEAEIVEQRDNEFLAWKTTSGTSHAGLVSFHRLDDNLTRVMVTMDFRPSGMIEKMASGLRFVKRAVQADLARFKSYIEFQEAGLEPPQERLRQLEQEDEQEKDEGQNDEERARSEQDGRQGTRSEQEEQQGARSESDQGDDGEEDRDRDSEREERQSRREQRREKTTA